MAINEDEISSAESIGFGSQMGDSLKGILSGIILFPVSLVVLYQVETCTQASDAFKRAKPIAQKEEGKPIYVTGKLDAEPIESKFIKLGKYIRISESSEVYAWNEVERTEGTGNNKRKVIKCELEWTSSPESPQHFTKCKGKPFHQRTVKDEIITAKKGQLKTDQAIYTVNLEEVSLTSSFPTQFPNNDSIIPGRFFIGSNFLYSHKNCEFNPVEGCERISLTVIPIPEGVMTFFGDVKENQIVRYVYEDKTFLNAGIGTYEQAMETLKKDDARMKWIGRGIGFVAMWLSFILMAGPLMTLLEFIPVVGEFGKGMLNVLFGIVAFLLSALIVLLIKFWYIWLALILAIVGFAIYKRRFALHSV